MLIHSLITTCFFSYNDNNNNNDDEDVQVGQPPIKVKKSQDGVAMYQTIFFLSVYVHDQQELE